MTNPQPSLQWSRFHRLGGVLRRGWTVSDPRSLVNLLPPSLSLSFCSKELVDVCARARIRPGHATGTWKERPRKDGRCRTNTGLRSGEYRWGVVGMAAYTNTTARELKVEEIAGTVGGGGADEVVGASGRRGGAAGGGRARQFNRNGRTRHIWRASDTLCAFRSLFSPSKNVPFHENSWNVTPSSSYTRYSKN